VGELRGRGDPILEWSDHLSTQETSPSANHDIEFRRQSEADVNKGIRIYVVTFLVLTAFAWCIVGIRGAILHRPYPGNTLFYVPEVRFSDFLDLSQRVPHWHEPHVLSRTDIRTTYPYPYPYPYPTPSFYVFAFFVRLFPQPLRAYLIFALLSFLLATCFFSLRVKRTTQKKLPQIAIWSTLLLGFPLQFLIDRGNIEAVIWVLILLGAVAYTRSRMLPSAILWSLAASMKIFPSLLFVLFLARRKFGTFAVAVASTVAFSLLGLAGIGPTIHQAAAESSKSAAFLMAKYITAREATGFDHSLFQATKQVIYVGAWSSSNKPVVPDTQSANEKALRLYNLVTPLAAIFLYWFRLRRLPLLNQFIAYIILCVLLPYVSGDYTLVHVYIAWAAFLLFLLSDVATGRVRIPARAIHGILFSCAVVFVPLSYLEITRSPSPTFACGAQVKTVFLIVILLTVLRVPMPSSLFGDLQIPRSGSPNSPSLNSVDTV
jgi:Glycosyltransferase family 87